MARVEIDTVQRATLDSKQFWGWSLDLPVPGERRDQYALVVGGWVAHREIDGVDVEVLSQTRVVARWRADLLRADVAHGFPDLPINPACGFEGVLRTLDLPAQFELEVTAVRRGARTLLATVRGRRSALLAAVEDAPRPLSVVTLGRTGSTLLMQLLSHHPRIVVHPPFPYEARVLAYWTSVFSALASPASYLQALAQVDSRRYWWLGYTAFPAATYLEQDPAARQLGGAALENMASFARRQVASFYEASAGQQGKVAEGQGYFAEKHLPSAAPQAIRCELFPESREIYLVRDFRDMLASILAFDRQRGYRSFGREAGESDEDYVLGLTEAIEELTTARRYAGERGLLVRYEELVLQPRPTLEAILAFLGLERSAERIEAMIRGAEANPEARAGHRTSASARESIGRWERDLPPPLRDWCNVAFRESLADCGYL